MLKSDFYYDLPEELIAQTPLEPRDSSRLMAVDRQSGAISHDRFYNICDYLKKGDLLVMNDSKVFPARIFGTKQETGAAVQFLLLEQITQSKWEVMVKPGKRLKIGTKVDFSGLMTAEIVDYAEGGNRIAQFYYEGNIFDVNTIYSNELGSAAAPTAGLHFTDNVFASLKEREVDTAFVTLHVGLGTFRPVKEDNILDHKMHVEHYSIPEETAQKIKECRERGGRVIAVGTTSCRTLESAASADEKYEITACSADTGIFIYPGYKFKAIDGLITNFHLPESTLIMLVSAFLGKDETMEAYKTAIDEKYRFFSFGDSMIII